MHLVSIFEWEGISGVDILFSRMSFLHLEAVSKTGSVRNVQFSLEKHEKCAIIGETGSGKTSLLKLIGGLYQPDGGEIRFMDKKVQGPLDRLIPGHPGIAYLSQHFELWNNYRVEEILRYHVDFDNEMAETLFTLCDIQHLRQRRSDQLSGGERQRVALARLLTSKPRLLLLDEPFSNLDRSHKTVIKKVIDNIRDSLDITCLLVSHEPADVVPWADRILVMQQGAIIQDDQPEQIYYRPVNEYCANLLGDYNLLNLSQGRRHFIRPEQITVSLESMDSWRKGTVTECKFYGNYFMLKVKAGHDQWLVQTQNSVFSEGTEVYLAFNEDEPWMI